MPAENALLTAVNMLLDETAAGSMTEANARLDRILDPGPGIALDPQFTLLRLMSALLGRLIGHADYEVWDEEDRDNTDGLLREIIHQAVQLRPKLVAGEPDLPPGAEVLARADELDPSEPDAPAPEARKALRLLAAAVQAFEDAGLTDGSHFLNMAAHVWGFASRDIHDPDGPTATVAYDGTDPAKLGFTPGDAQ